jgi:PDDEXK-like domain of unknown function (DUF3799)
VTYAEYSQTPGLSHSALEDLAVSPLRYWYKWINQERPADEPTPQMQFGSAVHCAVLEPAEFDKRYAAEVEVPEGCLDTVADLRSFLDRNGLKAKGNLKADIIAQVQAVSPEVPILAVLEAQHAIATAGKIVFKAADYKRVQRAAESLLNEPRIQEILEDGEPECWEHRTDPETGVGLRALLDWKHPKLTLDLKTFTQKREKSIDQTVVDAIWYEGYYRQAVFYGLVRGWPKEFNGEFVLAFVESEPPHETRIRSIRPKAAGQFSMLWERGRVEIQNAIRRYAELREHFGERPWRYAQDVSVLEDEEVKPLAFS